VNLGIHDEVNASMKDLGLDLRRMIDQEEEPGLGNGGLGRLAACYMDSLAMPRIPRSATASATNSGFFDQRIEDGWQKEVTDPWLHLGNPWEDTQAGGCVLM